MIDVEHYLEQLRAVYGGRRWIVAQDVLVACGRTAAALTELGAEEVFCLAPTRGAGDTPDPEVYPQLVLGVEGHDMMSSIRAGEAALGDLPPEAHAQLDAFDPDRSAPVVSTMFSAHETIARRPVFGGRPATWCVLEDKTIIDDLWDAAGVRRAPRRIVKAEREELERAAADLDQGKGTIWVGDNREGFHGGAQYLRWVRAKGDAQEAIAFLTAHCHRVRVMPFLDGVPCSIHGLAFPETQIALRPCEMVVFRVPGSNSLTYAGASTFWDPEPADRDEMRAVALRVGAHLRETVGFRGFFTVDGVLTAEGFLPTELNPRFGAALGTLGSGLPELPLYLFHLAIAANSPGDWRPDQLEELLLHHAELNRRGGGMQVLKKRFDEDFRASLAENPDGTWRRAGEDEEVDAELIVGPYPMGCFLRAALVPERSPIGPPAAPRVAAALRFVDAEWEMGIGELEAAPEVR